MRIGVMVGAGCVIFIIFVIIVKLNFVGTVSPL
jgi:hypothetical protein